MKTIVILTAVCCIAVAQEAAIKYAEDVCDDRQNYENSTQEACRECFIDFTKSVLVVGTPMRQVRKGLLNALYNCSIHFNEQERFLQCAKHLDLRAEDDCVFLNAIRVKGADAFNRRLLTRFYCVDFQGVREIEECRSCGFDALKPAGGDDWTGKAETRKELLVEKSKIFFDSCSQFFPSEEGVRACYEVEDPIKCWNSMHGDKYKEKTE